MVRTNGRPRPPDTVLSWVYLMRIVTLMQRRHGPDFRAAGLTGPQFDVLAQLGNCPEGITQRGLGERLICTKANVSVLARNMIRRGWLERREMDQDRRCNLVRLSEKGRRLRASILPAHEREIHRVLSEILTPAELRRLRQLLYRVVRTLYRGPASGGARKGRGVAEKPGGQSS